MGIVADLATPAPTVLLNLDQDMMMVLVGFAVGWLLRWPPAQEITVPVALTAGRVAVDRHSGGRSWDRGRTAGARSRVVLDAGRHGTTLRTCANRLPAR